MLNSDFNQLDLVIVASMTGADLQSQNHLSSLVTQILGTSCPVISVDAACASSSSGFGVGLSYLTSQLTFFKPNQPRSILIIGAEKMTDHNVPSVTASLAGAASHQQEASHGITFPALGGLVASRYFNEHPQVSPNILAQIAIKNHTNGLDNPIAHIQKPLTEKAYQQAPYIADPLRLFDAAPISDGATAVVISNQPQKNSTKVIAFTQNP